MKLKSISFNNFKYVPNNKQIDMSFDDFNLIIMGGPNGYGKTTIFDAIELLITGNIKHFNSDLPNRGKENISVLANNPKQDITIIGQFSVLDDVFVIQRVFESKNNFESLIYKNDDIITNDELYLFLGINKSFFDLGIYVSQMDSLNFLQQKYKTRKEFITDILDNQQIEKTLEQYKEIKVGLESKFKAYEEEVISNLNSLKETEKVLREKIKGIQLSEEKIPYVRLFPNKKFIFDKEVFDKEDSFDVVISPLNELIEYTKYYEDFLVKQRNLEIGKYLDLDKKIYLTEYYSNEIQSCNDNLDLIKQIKIVQKTKQEYDQKKFSFSDEIANILGLDTTIINKIKELLLNKSNIEKNMSDTQTLITNLLNKRNELIKLFDSSVEKGAIASNSCPLCGRIYEDLESLFVSTEESLKSNLGLVVDRLKEVLNELSNIFKSHIINKIEELVFQNKDLLEKYTLLNAYLSIDSNELNEYLTKNNIKFCNSSEPVDFTVFEQKYIDLIEIFKNFIKPEKAVISDEMYIKFQQISLEYYNQRTPYNEKDLLAKKFYIASIFSNSLNAELQSITGLFGNLDKAYRQQKDLYNNKIRVLSKLIDKYSDAYKEYQSSIVQNIAIPMFIFSGKIIQNYPLGLGVSMDVQNNAVVFKSGGKKTDIFNSLSTGQLNGVIISLLLSINEVFTSEESIKILLIDDPLQSIDDISAISFIDLLSENFNDTQILLSTHEDDKLKLISKKYEQSNNRSKVFNMQSEYLKI